ncbi:MAG: hypothetical protein U5K00_23205 [Melioribacteraceae bacterium]|nr:hypothetical protein [Melioribacteraceae bacterium]
MTMTLEELKDTLQNTTPPENLSDELTALWYDGKNNWDKAHQIVQNLSTSNAAWVHAYLHRKEGDEGNAGYWYRRANKDFPKLTLQNEWDEIAYFLLKEN